MEHIGFKNFRQFKNFPNMQLGGITILVGSNNSGKSTIEKAMMLTLDNLRSNKITSTTLFNGNVFHFDCSNIHDVHVNTFGRALNHHVDSKEITFSVGLDDFDITLVLKGDDPESSDAFIQDAFIRDKEFQVSYDINYAQSSMTMDASQSSDENEENVSSVEKHIADLQARITTSTSPLESANLNEELKRARVLKETLKATSSDKDKVTIGLPKFDNIANENILVNYIRRFAEYAHFTTTGDKRKKAYKETKQSKQFLLSREKEIIDSASRLNNAIYNTPLVYIQAHAAFQKAVFSTEDKNDYTATVLYRFIQHRINRESEAHKFVTDWMNKFGLGVDFIIESLQGTAFSVRIFDKPEEYDLYVKTHDKMIGVDLADKGMGSNQIMLMLWNMATVISDYKENTNKPLIIIEEPEQNLHPQVQSLLADLFTYLNDTYGFRFVIESHSEYLVRHVQVLAALQFKSGKEDVPYKVYYIKGAQGEEEPFYDMCFQRNGKFVRAFGKGFFDVADDSAEELYDIEEE